MKENNLISIIIPVYNCEKYLDRCIKSILKQNYSNFEIILVDDGSTDKSGKICDYYKKNHNNIYVIHKKNTGQSDSRNIGTKFSKGNLIMYIDSDDELSCDCLSELETIFKSGNFDLLFFRNNIFTDTSFQECSSCTEEVITFKDSKDAYMYYLTSNKMSCCLWSRIYSRKLALKVKMIDGLLCEDIESTHRYIYNSSKIGLIDKAFYNYYIRKDSTMGKKKVSHMVDIYKVAKMVYEFEISEFSSPYLQKIINSKYINNIIKSYSMLYNCKEEKIKNEYLPMINKDINKFSIFSNLKIKSRISLIIFKINKRLIANLINTFGSR